jgi:hypothetical protein
MSYEFFERVMQWSNPKEGAKEMNEEQNVQDDRIQVGTGRTDGELHETDLAERYPSMSRKPSEHSILEGPDSPAYSRSMRRFDVAKPAASESEKEHRALVNERYPSMAGFPGEDD